MPTFRILSAQEANELDEYDYENNLIIGHTYTIERFDGNTISIDGQTYKKVSPSSHWFVLVRPKYDTNQVIIPNKSEYGTAINGVLTLIAKPVINYANYSDSSDEDEKNELALASFAMSEEDYLSDDSSEDSSRYDGINPNSTYIINWGTSRQIVRNGITYEQFSEHLWAIVPQNKEASTRVLVRNMIRFEDEDISDDDTMDTSAGGRRKKSHKRSYRKKGTFRRVVSKKRKPNKRPTKRCHKTKTKSKRRKTRRRH
jgi:hypothetical protein